MQEILHWRLSVCCIFVYFFIWELLNMWKIKIIEEKSHAILFPFDKSPKKCYVINKIQQFLYEKLLFKKHIDQICAIAMKASWGLYSLLKYTSLLNLKNKLLLYKTVIRAIMLYACPVWRITLKFHRRKFQVIQNKSLEIIHNLHWRHNTQHFHEKHKFT